MGNLETWLSKQSQALTIVGSQDLRTLGAIHIPLHQAVSEQIIQILSANSPVIRFSQNRTNLPTTIGQKDSHTINDSYYRLFPAINDMGYHRFPDINARYSQIPSGELTFCNGKSPLKMGKSTINGHFPLLC